MPAKAKTKAKVKPVKSKTVTKPKTSQARRVQTNSTPWWHLVVVVAMAIGVILMVGWLGQFNFDSRGSARGNSQEVNLPASQLPGLCTDVYKPVCGADGQTYSNSCYASQKRVAIACEQECPCVGSAQPVGL